MTEAAPLKNPIQEYRIFRRRILVAVAIGVILVLTLTFRLLDLQILQHPYYDTLALGNRIRTLPINPPRGILYDRHGIVLAENVPSYELVVHRDDIRNLKDTLHRIESIVPIRRQDLRLFWQLVRVEPPYEPVPLQRDLSTTSVARLAVNLNHLPGVSIRAHLKRFYPLGPIGAHLLGYVGPIHSGELRRNPGHLYNAESDVGQDGFEQSYENLLYGIPGIREVEVNVQGRLVRVVHTQPPVPGDSVYLTIDARLQAIAHEMLGQNAGAVVAVDPHTGGILAMASTPSFNPNRFVNGIREATYRKLSDNLLQPLFNRALQGEYAPASTIKPFLALAVLDDHVITTRTTIFCPGTFVLPGTTHVYHDWQPWGHGITNLRKALTQSVDVFFYHMAVDLGIHRIDAFLRPFGFGQKPDIDLAGARAGVLPSPGWKLKHMGGPWYEGDTVISGIGQGYWLVTPLQMAVAVGTIAARGHRYRPRVIHAIANPTNHRVYPVLPEPARTIRLDRPGLWRIVARDMESVIKNPTGTAHGIDYGLKYALAGKTGTAQISNRDRSDFMNYHLIPKSERDNAVFIAFGPIPHPEIAVAVFVQHGVAGALTAAPIARRIIETYLEERGIPPHQYPYRSLDRDRGS
ncbi:MAG: penicillin-binding protein 2 [Gammaproteobacteria bacterium]